MSKRMIFLLGAPSSQSLRWEEDELLNAPIYPFQGPEVQNEVTISFSETRPVKWRLLSRPKTPEGGRVLELESGTEFFTSYDLTCHTSTSNALEMSELCQFYDHSFAIHETSAISPVLLSENSTIDSGQWTESTETSMASWDEREIEKGPGLTIQGGFLDLQDIPNAAYLRSIMPQTMTVNLIVTVIAIRPPRRIVTRQWKKELDLVEVVVADETKSGFGVTFWLPPTDHKVATRTSDEGGEVLRKSLMRLRPRDIVLLRVVGLSCFRERVYGQSLRKGFTKIDLLYRQQVDATDTGGIYRLRDIDTQGHAAKNADLPLAKVCKVHEWIKRFVDLVPDQVGGGERKTVTLPPDTQEN